MKLGLREAGVAIAIAAPAVITVPVINNANVLVFTVNLLEFVAVDDEAHSLNAFQFNA